MASIEIRASYVNTVPVIGDVYHLYVIVTQDNGEQWVLRAGPSQDPRSVAPQNMLAQLVGEPLGEFGIPDYGFVNGIYQQYTNFDGSVHQDSNGNNPPDWDSEGTHLRTEEPFATGTDAEIDTLVDQMLTAVSQIDNPNKNYKYVPSHQNSNTFATVAVDATGLPYELPKIDGEAVTAPAAFGDFDDDFSAATILGDRLEDVIRYLENELAKPFKQMLDEAGKTVGEWVDDLGDSIGNVSLPDLLNGAKELFGDLLDIAPDFTAHAADNGNIILEGTNGFDTVIDGDTGEVHTGIPHNVAVGGVPTPSVSLSDILSNSPIISGLFGGNHSTPSVLNGPVIQQIHLDAGTVSGAQGAIIENSPILPTTFSDGTPLPQDIIINPITTTPLDDNGNPSGQPSTIFIIKDKDGNELDVIYGEQSSNSFSGTGISTGNAPSIAYMIGEAFANVAGMLGAAAGAVLSAAGNILSTGVSILGGALSGVLGFIGGFFGIGGGSESTPSVDAGGSGGFAAPVAVDLDGDGIEFSSLHESSTFFDVDGDGYLEKTAWTTGDDGLLVIDLFQDGSIDFGEEVNFTLWDDSASTDMEALRNVFDSNANGLLDAGDDRFAEFKIWQDFNTNGFVDAGELKTLQEMGINAISIDSAVPADEQDGTVVAGNIVYDETSVDWDNNNSGLAYDTALEYSVGGIKFNGDSEEFSINYEDGRVVNVYQAPEGTPLVMDAASGNYDVVVGTAANDIITNSGDVDIILDGGAGDDSLTGGSGDDWLYGGTGIDTMHGGAGNDLLFVDDEDIWANIDGGEGEDIAILTSANGVTVNISDYNIEKIFGNSGNDNFSASGSGAVKLDGGAGDDILTGADGDDELIGGLGNDVLNAKGGNDFLSGGLGSDRFIIEVNPGTTTEINGFDTRDMAEKIDLSAFDLTELIIVTNNESSTIHLGNDQYINLTNTNMSEIDSRDFIFQSGTTPNIVKHVQGSGQGEIIKGSNIDDVIDVGGGTNYVVTGRGNDVIYTNPDALDVIKITRQEGKTDTIYGFNSYNKTQLTYWMGNFTGNAETGEGTITSGTPELWAEKTVQMSFNNTKFDLSEFNNLDGVNSISTRTSGNDTIIELGYGQTIILKDYVQLNETKNYTYGRDWIGYGGDQGANFIVDYDILNAKVTSANFIFSSNGSSIGSLIDDEMHGSDEADMLSGGEGDDVILGYRGTDLLTGGNGDDYLSGGDQNDGISGGEGNDEIYGDAGNDAMWGKEGNDTIYGGTGQDFLTGDEGNDTLYGGDDEDTYIYELGDGRDVIIDTGSNNSADVIKFNGDITEDSLILTRDGDDLAITFKENSYDRITIQNQYTGGTDGVEIIRFADNTQIMLNTLGLKVDGTVGADTLHGSEHNDTITGGRGDDVLYGGEGDDIYVFNAGDGQDIIDETGIFSNADVIRMGSNIQSSDVSYENINNDLVITFANNSNDQITVKNHYNTDNSRVEKVLFADGSEIDLVNTASLINGNAGNNIISGTSYNDNIYGGEGADVLEGGAGADTIDGGDGDDIISYRNSPAAVQVNLQNGTAFGGDAEGDVYSNIEGVEGSAYDDSLTGDSIGNRLYGLDGADTIDGKGGNDQIFGGKGADHILGGAGDDYIDGGDGADILEGNDGNDSIFGGAGGDILFGGAGDDYLSGGTEGDIINGGSGNDRLTTGFGNDVMVGGSGVDRFNISKSANIEDVINDYEFGIGEKIDLWAFSHIKEFDDLAFSQNDNDTIIALGNKQTLRIKDTTLEQFSADDFTFREKPVEFIVNSDREGDQINPDIAALDNGNFVVTWATTTGYVSARIFEADGTPQGNEFQVSTQPEGWVEPSVSELSNGKFIVTWNSSAIASDGNFDIAAQIFDASGQKVGSEFTVNTNTNLQQYKPDVTNLDNGNFVVSWYSHN